MKILNLNISFKHHLTVSLIVSIWLVLFIVIIAPFDASDLSFSIRLKILPFYGLISFLSYLVLVPIQNIIFKKNNGWNIVLEIIYIFVFSLLCLVGSYTYYKSSIINGDYQLVDFIFKNYYPIFFFALSVIIFSRWFLNRKTTQPKSEKLILKGENKLDILKVDFKTIICISSAGNYVEVNYLHDGILKKKLLRITLKHIQSDISGLLKVHRSCLINPLHFKDWKNASTINMTQMEVPVSKNYKKDVIATLNPSLKITTSSLN